MIKFLIEKEFKQLFRNSFLPKLISFPVHDYDTDALGRQSGDKEHQSEYSGQ